VPLIACPFPKYPALVDGNVVLYESFAITQYLASKYGADTPLAPKDVAEQALVQQWALWA
jgi:glutathione S-transferase